MAQRTEKEETEFKAVPETIALCVNCGVAGNSAANSLCQKCLSASRSVAGSASSFVAKAANHTLGEESFRSTSSRRRLPKRDYGTANTGRDLKKEASTEPEPAAKRRVNRCSGCRKKVGLTGFRCRCGDLFCAEHRYSDRHDCSYDYKGAGRDSIARENPVVRAAKLVKI